MKKTGDKARGANEHPATPMAARNIANYFDAAAKRTGQPAHTLRIMLMHAFGRLSTTLYANGLRQGEIGARELAGIFVNPAIVVLTGMEQAVAEKATACLKKYAEKEGCRLASLAIWVSVADGKVSALAVVEDGRHFEIPFGDLVSHFYGKRG